MRLTIISTLGETSMAEARRPRGESRTCAELLELAPIFLCQEESCFAECAECAPANIRDIPAPESIRQPDPVPSDHQLEVHAGQRTQDLVAEPW